VGEEKSGEQHGSTPLDIISERLTKYHKEKQKKWKHITISDTTDLTSGWETELYGYTLSYIDNNCLSINSLVARVYQGKYSAKKAEHEFDVIKKLGEAGYPVPLVFDIETNLDSLGTPFIIMEQIEGYSMMDDFLENPIDNLESYIQVFTNLFLELHQLGPSLIFPECSKFEYTTEYLEYIMTQNRQDIHKRSLSWLEPVIDWLEARIYDVSTRHFSVLHNDFHPGNIIVKPDGHYTVIDWASSRFGDYREDLMWTVLLANAFWGRSFGDILLKKYEQLAGEKVKDSEFFEVAAMYRRIRDTAISFSKGAEEASMRAGAVDQMKETITHLCNIHDFLQEITGIRLDEYDRLLRLTDTTQSD
jgi:aminoglycoside phosphotransferase (APT) family kinase protein